MKINANLELMLKYPMILSKNMSNSAYYGYIKVKDEDYRIDLTIKNEKYKLQLNDDLLAYEKQIEKLCSNIFTNPVEFLDKLSDLLAKNSPNKKIVDDTGIFRKVLSEYSELRHFYINICHAKLSRDLKTIEITHADERNRKHKLVVNVNYDAKDVYIFQIVMCDLPEYQEQLVKVPHSSLVTLYENFLSIVDCPNMQMIFDIFDEIDKNCCVLDPEKPSRKDLYRRIMIENTVSFVITFNSREFRDLPQFKFLGPNNAVKKYNEILNRNYINWNPNGNILLELQQLLDINNFPRQTKEFLEEELLVEDGECCICFALRLNDKLPEVVCPNQSCHQNFHTDCLYQWLCSLNSRKFYYEIYGNCPNCEKTIQCPLPSSI